MATSALEALPPDVRSRLSDVLCLEAAQQPAWPADECVEMVRRLAAAPPITASREVDALAARLRAVAAGDAFVVQGGDCAETFEDNTEKHVRGNLETIARVSSIVMSGGALPVVRLGRIAGQYAKPRSAPIDNARLPSYRGDMINSVCPEPAARRHDPLRILTAYANAASTMNFLRALTHGDYATGPSDTYVSHEALVLEYESALVRLVGSRLYALSGHALWVGERSRDLGGAHIAFVERVANPVGVKLGPRTTPEEAVEYVLRLCRGHLPGRLMLITRMGAAAIRDVLPPIVEKVTSTGHQVVWLCDPMHGNTELTGTGVKTRRFDAILDEVKGFFEVHSDLGTHPGGIHLELTGDSVAECLGGADAVTEADLALRYRSACDPRLNAAQSVELAAHTADLLRRFRASGRRS